MGRSVDAIIGYDLDGMLTGWNVGAQRLFGYTGPEMLGSFVTHLVPPGEQHAAEELRRQAITESRLDQISTVRIRRDGVPITVDTTIIPISDADGRVVAFTELFCATGASVDPAVAKLLGGPGAALGGPSGFDRRGRHDHYLEAEIYQRVRDDPAIFDFLQDGSLDGIWYWDLDNPEHEWMSPRLKQCFGYTDAEVPNTSARWQANIFPDDRDRALENFHKHAADPHHPYDQIVRYRHKNGSTVWVRCRGLIVRDATGRPKRMLGAHTDVTSLKQAEERLRAIQEASSDMHLTMELPGGAITGCNQAFLDLVGRPAAEVLGTPFVDLWLPTRQYAAQAALEELHLRGTAADTELAIRRANGTPAAVVLTGVAASDGDVGTASGIASGGSDVSGADRADGAGGAGGAGRVPASRSPTARAWLRDVSHLRRRANIQLLLESLPSSAVLLDQDGTIITANPPAEAMFGWRREELTGRDLAVLLPDAGTLLPGTLLPGTDAAGVHAGADPARSAGQLTGQERELTGRQRDSGGFPAEARAGPIPTREGMLTLVEIFDITERKVAEEALRDSERRFRQLAESLPQLVWTTGPDGECDFLGRQWVAYTGIPAELQLGYRWMGLLHPDDRPNVERQWRHAATTGNVLHTEFRLRGHDGEYRWFDTRAVPLRDGHGGIAKWFGTNTDITDRRRAEEEIRTSRAQLAAALEAGEMGVWLFDATSGQLELDEVGRLMLGTPPAGRSEALRAVVCSMLHPDDRAQLTQLAETMAGGADLGPIALEIRVVQADNTVRWLAARGRQDGGPRRTRATGIVQDITARRNADELRLRSQKLESIGTLAGGIAHDFNNILTAIGGNLDLAMLCIPPDDLARRYLNEIGKASARAAELAKSILTFSQPRDLLRQVSPLPPIVEEALRLLRATLPAQVDIRVDLPPDLPAVNVSASQIHQVTMNLVTNSAHAMPETGGVIQVRADVVIPDPELAKRAGLELTAYVRLSIQDNGSGIPAALLGRVFDPFFTTKASGKGTGLGLSVVHGIMTGHGGGITVSSTPGLGTVFELYIPVAVDQAGDGHADQSVPADASGIVAARNRVLFVDDEESIVQMALDLLGHFGLDVVAMTSSALALTEFRAAPDRFDVAVIDLTMPEISGLALAEFVRQIRPDIPIVLCSGLVSEETLDAAALLDITAVISKPYTTTELTAAIDEAVSRHQPRARDPR